MATPDKQLKWAKEGLKLILETYERSPKQSRNCAYTMWRIARNYLGFLEDLERQGRNLKPGATPADLLPDPERERFEASRPERFRHD